MLPPFIGHYSFPGWQEKYVEVRILTDAHLKLIKIPGPQRD